MTLLDLDDIASMMKLSPAYVRDKLVKRSDFPRPALFISQKLRRWSVDDVASWIDSQKQKIAR
jgi:predicted DNA-binding transcriptional regulator AlpA